MCRYLDKRRTNYSNPFPTDKRQQHNLGRNVINVMLIELFNFAGFENAVTRGDTAYSGSSTLTFNMPRKDQLLNMSNA